MRAWLLLTATQYTHTEDENKEVVNVRTWRTKWIYVINNSSGMCFRRAFTAACVVCDRHGEAKSEQPLYGQTAERPNMSINVFCWQSKHSQSWPQPMTEQRNENRASTQLHNNRILPNETSMVFQPWNNCGWSGICTVCFYYFVACADAPFHFTPLWCPDGPRNGSYREESVLERHLSEGIELQGTKNLCVFIYTVGKITLLSADCLIKANLQADEH